MEQLYTRLESTINISHKSLEATELEKKNAKKERPVKAIMWFLRYSCSSWELHELHSTRLTNLCGHLYGTDT